MPHPQQERVERTDLMDATTKTRNGTEPAAEPTFRAALSAFDALADYYLAACDAGQRLQARGVETARLLLDESASFQQANRRLAEQLIQNARRGQEELIAATERGIKTSESLLQRAVAR
jgi:hypothetical protein